jgi:hypothetical protein
MAYQILTNLARPRTPVRRNGLLQLGAPHFWLLAGVLGFMIAIIVIVIFAQILSS